MHEKGGYVYIMSNKYRTVLYFGVTSNLFNRVYEHRTLVGSSFTTKYRCVYLVYFECFGFIDEAIKREKQLKKWNRVWKENLIKEKNPGFKDLSDEIEDYR